MFRPDTLDCRAPEQPDLSFTRLPEAGCFLDFFLDRLPQQLAQGFLLLRSDGFGLFKQGLGEREGNILPFYKSNLLSYT